MISRTIGAEFGGAVGVIFYLANLLNAAQYTHVIATTATQLYGYTGEGSEACYAPTRIFCPIPA
jgi:hypothetical protein